MAEDWRDQLDPGAQVLARVYNAMSLASSTGQVASLADRGRTMLADVPGALDNPSPATRYLVKGINRAIEDRSVTVPEQQAILKAHLADVRQAVEAGCHEQERWPFAHAADSLPSIAREAATPTRDPGIEAWGHTRGTRGGGGATAPQRGGGQYGEPQLQPQLQPQAQPKRVRVAVKELDMPLDPFA